MQNLSDDNLPQTLHREKTIHHRQQGMETEEFGKSFPS